MKKDFTRRIDFLVGSITKLYGEQFDRLARERIGLTRAQCRLLYALTAHAEETPMSQAELAKRLNLTPMAVGGLCARLETAGWIHRANSPTDQRVRHVLPAPKAKRALDAALHLSDDLQARALARLSTAERVALISSLGKVHEGLLALDSEQAR